MKAYRDVFGKKLTKQDVVQAVIATVRSGDPYPATVRKYLGVGFGKANRLAKVLADAGITSPLDHSPRKVILKNEDAAVNAALRQLKKGVK